MSGRIRVEMGFLLKGEKKILNPLDKLNIYILLRTNEEQSKVLDLFWGENSVLKI